MDNIEYTICRYELYPTEFHTSIAVGFLVRDTNTNASGTLEHQVTLEEASGKTQSEVCDLAFSKLTDRNQSLLDYFQKIRNNAVGSYFIPS